MKPALLRWFLCLGVFAGSLWAIGILQAVGAKASYIGIFPTSSNSAVQSFASPKISLKYRDFDGVKHEFACEVDLAFVQHEEAEFGYPVDREIIFAELDKRLEAKIREQAGRLGPSVEIKVSHEAADQMGPPYSIKWLYHVDPLRMRGLGSQRQNKAKLLDLDGRIRADLSRYAETILRDYLREHGFDLGPLGSESDGRIDLAYKRLGDRYRELLTDCREKFVREAGPVNTDEVIKLLMAYFQEMPFEMQPVVDDGLYTNGLWVPTKTMRLRRGDCDSKSLAFCSMRSASGPQIILLITDLSEDDLKYVPPQMRAKQHVLIGIEAYPGLDQKSVTIGLRRYVLCEAMGWEQPPGKLLPGETLFSRLPTFWYCMTDDCTGTSLLSQVNFHI